MNVQEHVELITASFAVLDVLVMKLSTTLPPAFTSTLPVNVKGSPERFIALAPCRLSEPYVKSPRSFTTLIAAPARLEITMLSPASGAPLFQLAVVESEPLPVPIHAVVFAWTIVAAMPTATRAKALPRAESVLFVIGASSFSARVKWRASIVTCV